MTHKVFRMPDRMSLRHWTTLVLVLMASAFALGLLHEVDEAGHEDCGSDCQICSARNLAASLPADFQGSSFMRIWSLRC